IFCKLATESGTPSLSPSINFIFRPKPNTPFRHIVHLLLLSFRTLNLKNEKRKEKNEKRNLKP
ncbi:MAG: hypothetical protein KAT48_02010, partial [Bacteroidales bacterium]|nr:hypothetical protein [Bacteroidales bacterium]